MTVLDHPNIAEKRVSCRINGQPIGAYNTKQLRPDKETKLQDRYGLMEESTDEESLKDYEN